MGIRTGYALDIHVSHVKHNPDCDVCLAWHGYCKGKLECMRYYSRVISKVTAEIGTQNLRDITQKRILNELPVYCDSIFNKDNQMSEFEKNRSQEIIDLFKKFSKEFEESS